MFITKYFKKVDSVKPSQPPLVPPLQKIEHVASHSLKPIQNENISSLESEVSLIVPETADCTPISSYPSPEQAKHNSPHAAVSKVTILLFLNRLQIRIMRKCVSRIFAEMSSFS